ncbi:TPA: NTP transferase domain-containing protein [Burkholderia vietnamiensis]|nr:NTP transferase domain-containing protein [Burkholderia vietnamiensis]HEP6285435.1 NTP transferase domain-containing protein [Burkholderia vietnamiensis]HEP6310404.1 NTP transferase domain-containing protein [Burkholderia vietnamiensis]
MQIVIPMSGFGERFRRVGYEVPKPLIEIDGKPIISHVVDLFPGETDFVFICNKDHLANPAYRMEAILRDLVPSAKIVAIESHKLGPIHAVLMAAEHIDSSKPVVVNYCDFTCYWDWEHFKTFVDETQCDGAISAYKGFHPHTLGTTNYAYMRESNGWVKDIQEKKPYTENRMEEYASSGTYYFRSGELMLRAFEETEAKGRSVGGEFYVSLAYLSLLETGKSVAVYPLQHFMQWGTPEDVAEYKMWSAAFDRLSMPRPDTAIPRGTVIIPMAGLGERFAREGYTETKPLIEVSGLPMVVQAARCLPLAEQYVFVMRRDMPGHAEVTATLRDAFPGAIVEFVDGVTEGQACTALIGLQAAQRELGRVPEPVTFGACDFGALYDDVRFDELIDDSDTDVLVWGVKGHANASRHPEMFGWLGTDGERITQVSVKTPLGDPRNDPIVLGTFTFKRVADFVRCIEHMVAREARVKGEYYLDTCIDDAMQLGMSCRLFEVESYLSWGTPNDLRTFEYWQSCFSKWQGHRYTIATDFRVPRTAVDSLNRRYEKTVPRTAD